MWAKKQPKNEKIKKEKSHLAYVSNQKKVIFFLKKIKDRFEKRHNV